MFTLKYFANITLLVSVNLEAEVFCAELWAVCIMCTCYFLFVCNVQCDHLVGAPRNTQKTPTAQCQWQHDISITWLTCDISSFREFTTTLKKLSDEYLYQPQHPRKTSQHSASTGHSRTCASTPPIGSSIHLKDMKPTNILLLMSGLFQRQYAKIHWYYWCKIFIFEQLNIVAQGSQFYIKIDTKWPPATFCCYFCNICL